MAKKEKFTSQQVVDAIREANGLASEAAKLLKCGLRTIYDYSERYPEVKQAREDAHDAMLDRAESKLHGAVERGEAWAICFFLKTQGKGRGYSERHEVTGKDGQAIELKEVEVRTHG